ncbi:unnamed protein product [Sympodiomycopsis kandeliae]
MRTGQAAAAKSPEKVSPVGNLDLEQQPPAVAAAAESDAETEVLPFSDDGEDEEQRAVEKSDLSNSQPDKMDVDQENKTTDQAQAEGSSAHDDAAAALAGLVEATTDAPANAQSNQDDGEESEDGLSSESDLSDAPDEIEAESRQAQAAQEDAEGEEEEQIDADADADADSDGGSTLSDDSDTETALPQRAQPETAADQESDSDDALDGDDDDDQEAGDGDEEEEDEEEEDEEEEDEEDREEGQAGRHQTRPGGGRRARQELRDAAIAQDAGDEREEEEDAASSLAALAGGATNVEGEGSEDEAADTVPDDLAELSNKAGVSTAVTQAALRARKPSLMGPQILVDPAAESEAATSRQGSPADDDADAVERADEDVVESQAGGGKAAKARRHDDENKTVASKDDGIASEDVSKDDQLRADTDTAAGTPIPEQPEAEEDSATDEAAVRRLEAMDALAKIEIKVALLRDRLYVERSMEIAKETEMILEGTHPELVHITALIEARRLWKLRTLETWFEEEQRHFAKMAAAEEREAQLTWRAETAELRRDLMNDWSSKRRKLEREKRSIDAPRPARRHQVFETELIGEPELAAAAARAAKADREAGNAGKRRAKREAKELAELGSHIALPDLHGLEDYDAWGDLERMGILRPDPRLAPAMQGPPLRGSPQPQHPHSNPQHQRHSQPPEMAYYGQPTHPMPGPSTHPGWPAEPQGPYGAPAVHGGRPMHMPDMNPYGLPHEQHMYGARPGEMPEDVYGPEHMYPGLPHAGYGMQHRHPSPPQAFAPEGNRNGRPPASRQQRNHSRPPPGATHLDPYGRPLSPELGGDPRYGPHPAERHHHRHGPPPGIAQHPSPHDRHAMLPHDERDIKPNVNGHSRLHEYENLPHGTPPTHYSQSVSPSVHRHVEHQTHQPTDSRHRSRGPRHAGSPLPQHRSANSTAHLPSRSRNTEQQPQRRRASPEPRAQQQSPPSPSYGEFPSAAGHYTARSPINGRPAQLSDRAAAEANGIPLHARDARAGTTPQHNPRRSPQPVAPAAAASVAAAFSSQSAASNTAETSGHPSIRSPSHPGRAASHHTVRSPKGTIQEASNAGSKHDADGGTGARTAPKSPEIAHRLPLSVEAEQQVADDFGLPSEASVTATADTAVKTEQDRGAAASGKEEHDSDKVDGPASNSIPAPQSYPPRPYEEFPGSNLPNAKS